MDDESWVGPTRKRRFGSDLVAARLLKRMGENRSNLTLFIHGYNNNAIDALNRGHRLSDRYSVEVLVFSWPANGGGEATDPSKTFTGLSVIVRTNPTPALQRMPWTGSFPA